MVEYYYDAWRKILSVTGTLATTLGVLNPFRYRGYVFDEETGLYYLRSRYYDPNWDRFLNADDRIITTTHWPSNTFMYCNNVPVQYSDQTGHIPTEWDVRFTYSRCGGLFLSLMGYEISKACYNHFLMGEGKPLPVDTLTDIAIAVAKSSVFKNDIIASQPESEDQQIWVHTPQNAIEMQGDLYYAIQHISPTSLCFRTKKKIYGISFFSDLYDFAYRSEAEEPNLFKRIVNNECGYALQENGYGTNYTINVVFFFEIKLE